MREPLLRVSAAAMRGERAWSAIARAGGARRCSGAAAGAPRRSWQCCQRARCVSMAETANGARCIDGGRGAEGRAPRWRAVAVAGLLPRAGRLGAALRWLERRRGVGGAPADGEARGGPAFFFERGLSSPRSRRCVRSTPRLRGGILSFGRRRARAVAAAVLFAARARRRLPQWCATRAASCCGACARCCSLRAPPRAPWGYSYARGWLLGLRAGVFARQRPLCAKEALADARARHAAAGDLRGPAGGRLQRWPVVRRPSRSCRLAWRARAAWPSSAYWACFRGDASPPCAALLDGGAARAAAGGGDALRAAPRAARGCVAKRRSRSCGALRRA